MNIFDWRTEFHSILSTKMFRAELSDLILHGLKIKLTAETTNIKPLSQNEMNILPTHGIS